MTKTHYYTGITAFFEDNSETHFRMKALADAIPGLSDQLIKDSNRSQERLYNVTSSWAFSSLQANQPLFTPAPDTLPIDTHHDRHAVSLGYAEIDGMPHIALYIPVVATDAGLVKDITENALRSVILALFGENLIDIEMVSGTSEDRYDNLLMQYLYR